MPLYAKATLMWFVLLTAMMGNGALRVLVWQPRFGEDPARQLATVLGAAIVVALACPFVRRLGPTPPRQLLGIGIVWVILTLIFEFPFGRYAFGKSWEELLAEYDLAAGRLWPLFLVVTLLAPWAWGVVFGRARRDASD